MMIILKFYSNFFNGKKKTVELKKKNKEIVLKIFENVQQSKQLFEQEKHNIISHKNILVIQLFHLLIH